MIADHGHKADNTGAKRRKTELIVLSAIVLFGLYLRLMLLAGTTIDTPFRADARQYTAYAYNLRYHGIYSNNFKTIENPKLTPSPDAFRSPGYPLFLYLFTSSKTGDRFAVNVFYAQALISAATIAAAYILGRMLIGSIGGTVVALLTAVSPHLINANFFLLTETLFAFFLVSGATVLLIAIRTENKIGLAASGIILAVAALIKPTLQYFIVFLICFILFQPGIHQKRLTILMIAMPFIAIFSGWLVRNVITLGYLSDPSLSIYTLQHGMYPHFMYNGDPRTFGYPYRFDPHTKQIASSMSSVISAIVNRFLTQPGDHVIWFLSKPLYLFRWDMIQSSGTFFYPVQYSPYQTSFLFAAMHKTMHLIHPILMFSSGVGSLLVWLPEKRLAIGRATSISMRLLSLLYLYFILVHIAGAPFPRYSIPLRPISYVLAVMPIAIALSAFGLKRYTKR